MKKILLSDSLLKWRRMNRMQDPKHLGDSHRNSRPICQQRKHQPARVKGKGGGATLALHNPDGHECRKEQLAQPKWSKSARRWSIEPQLFQAQRQPAEAWNLKQRPAGEKEGKKKKNNENSSSMTATPLYQNLSYLISLPLCFYLSPVWIQWAWEKKIRLMETLNWPWNAENPSSVLSVPLVFVLFGDMCERQSWGAVFFWCNSMYLQLLV